MKATVQCLRIRKVAKEALKTAGLEPTHFHARTDIKYGKDGRAEYYGQAAAYFQLPASQVEKLHAALPEGYRARVIYTLQSGQAVVVVED